MFIVYLYLCPKLHFTVIVIYNFCPVIIVIGLIVACTPSLCGKPFNQITQLYTISTISHGGYLSNGRAVSIDLTSFTVLMCLSISCACSSAARFSYLYLFPQSFFHMFELSVSYFETSALIYLYYLFYRLHNS